MRLYHCLPRPLKVGGLTFEMVDPIYEGKIYNDALQEFRPLREKLAELKAEKRRYRIISVLSRNLRGVTDLHGRLYQPHQWLYTETK